MGIAASAATTLMFIVGQGSALGFQTLGESSPVTSTAPTTAPSAPTHSAPSRHPKPTKPDRDRQPERHTAAQQKPDRPATKSHVSSPGIRTASSSQGRLIARIASRHIGARFQIGATGPRYFDCSGLIYRVYSQAGLLDKIGGNRSAAGYYYWFKQRGLANRHSPHVGDLVIWTHNGQISHSGIYVGGGRVISALINPWGVKKTHINTIHAKFLAYLHVRW
jgi:cell wall-associated NlpC family hydrolase